jgi:DNA modification methylase
MPAIPHPTFERAFGADSPFRPAFSTGLGLLHAGDCMDLLAATLDGSVDCVFADPPFNLRKEYGPGFTDDMPDGEYVAWCKRWLAECIRVLAPGGSLFLYNLPRWNIVLGAWLMEQGLTFRHDIAIGMKAGFPIRGRLYPARYSLLYMTKGDPRVFRTIRTPLETCRHCGKELKDYGGYRSKMHEKGVSLTDMWTDIVPVRHKKYKTANRSANALSTKILERVVEISTLPGDLVLDPFGGSGTTFAVCEDKGRRWIGAEIDFAAAIAGRLTDSPVPAHRNDDHVCA